MTFRTMYSDSVKFHSAAGEGIRPTYKSVLNKNGDIELVENGIEDVYSKIQSFKDSVDINVILERFAHGDSYALGQNEGFYGDFVEVPRSYMEALNAAIDLRNVYESDDIKSKGISFDDFVSSVLDPVLDTNAVVKEDKKESEVLAENE